LRAARRSTLAGLAKLLSDDEVTIKWRFRADAGAVETAVVEAVVAALRAPSEVADATNASAVAGGGLCSPGSWIQQGCWSRSSYMDVRATARAIAQRRRVRGAGRTQAPGIHRQSLSL
jgi:hypothetical protein